MSCANVDPMRLLHMPMEDLVEAIRQMMRMQRKEMGCECDSAEAEAEADSNQSNPIKAPKEERKPTEEDRKAMYAARLEMANRFQHLYRPQQHTRVTVHNVVFWLRGARKRLVSASFHGAVIAMRQCTPKTQIAIRVKLLPRWDIEADQIGICGAGTRSKYPNGKHVWMRRASKDEFSIVLIGSRMDPSLGYISLGSKCKEDRCRVDCQKHKLHGPQDL